MGDGQRRQGRALANQPPTPADRYALVEVAGEGKCLAWWNPYRSRWERAGGPSADDAIALSAEAVSEVALRELTSRRLRVATPGDGYGVVGRPGEGHASVYISRTVSGVVPGPDTFQLRPPSGRRGARFELWRLCLAD